MLTNYQKLINSSSCTRSEMASKATTSNRFPAAVVCCPNAYFGCFFSVFGNTESCARTNAWWEVRWHNFPAVEWLHQRRNLLLSLPWMFSEHHLNLQFGIHSCSEILSNHSRLAIVVRFPHLRLLQNPLKPIVRCSSTPLGDGCTLWVGILLQDSFNQLTYYIEVTMKLAVWPNDV